MTVITAAGPPDRELMLRNALERLRTREGLTYARIRSLGGDLATPLLELSAVRRYAVVQGVDLLDAVVPVVVNAVRQSDLRARCVVVDATLGLRAFVDEYASAGIHRGVIEHLASDSLGRRRLTLLSNWRPLHAALGIETSTTPSDRMLRGSVERDALTDLARLLIRLDSPTRGWATEEDLAAPRSDVLGSDLTPNAWTLLRNAAKLAAPLEVGAEHVLLVALTRSESETATDTSRLFLEKLSEHEDPSILIARLRGLVHSSEQGSTTWTNEGVRAQSSLILYCARNLADDLGNVAAIHGRHILGATAIMGLPNQVLDALSVSYGEYCRRLVEAVEESNPDDVVERWQNLLNVLAIEELAGAFSSDLVRPDMGIPASNDRLGMGPYVGMFATLIAAKSTPLPLSVGLFGEWGSGKSTFMGLLRERLRLASDSGNAEYCEHIVQIGFNAWSYSDSNLWASLGDEIFNQLGGPAADPTASLRDELRGRRQLATELEVAKQNAEEEAERLGAALKHARYEYLSSTRNLMYAAVQDKIATRLRKAMDELGVKGVQDQAEMLSDELRGIRFDLSDVRRTVGSRTMGFAVALALLGLIAVAIGFIDGNPLVVLPGISVVLATLGFVAEITLKARRALGIVRREVRRISDILEEGADSALSEPIEETQRAEARRDVVHAQLEQVLEHAGQLERELLQLAPGQRLYTFLSERASSSDYRSQLGLISTIRNDFEQLAGLLADWRNRPDDKALRKIDRIVLYIDDLDRCSPRQVVDVLQAVHLMLALDLFVVVVGVDPRWLLNALELEYERLLGAREWSVSDDLYSKASTPRDYLEKIFNIPFVLPTMTSATYRTLVDDLTSDLQEEDQSAAGSSRQDQQFDRSLTDQPLLAAEAGSEVSDQESISGPTTEVEARAALERRKARPMTPAEVDVLHALAPLMRTPRETKRLVNVYRMIRSTRDLRDASRFLGTSAEPGEFQAVAIMLGLLSAHPDRFGTLLWSPHGGLCTNDAVGTWSEFLAGLQPKQSGMIWQNGVCPAIEPGAHRAWEQLVAAARPSADLVGQRDLSAFKFWGPHVARFSFSR